MHAHRNPAARSIHPAEIVSLKRLKSQLCNTNFIWFIKLVAIFGPHLYCFKEWICSVNPGPMQDKSRLLQQRTASFVCLLFVSQMFIFIKGNVCTLHGPVGWMLFPQFARRTGPPWRMSGVLIKCWQLTFLQTTDILIFVRNMIYTLHITWLFPDCHIERWRGRWRSYRWQICQTDCSTSVRFSICKCQTTGCFGRGTMIPLGLFPPHYSCDYSAS